MGRQADRSVHIHGNMRACMHSYVCTFILPNINDELVQNNIKKREQRTKSYFFRVH